MSKWVVFVIVMPTKLFILLTKNTSYVKFQVLKEKKVGKIKVDKYKLQKKLLI